MSLLAGTVILVGSSLAFIVALSYKCFDSVLPAIFLKCPVVLAIEVVAHPAHNAFEEPAQVVIVWLLLELEPPTIVDVLAELFGVLPRQLLDRSLALFVLDSIVLLVLVFACEALPGQLTL